MAISAYLLFTVMVASCYAAAPNPESSPGDGQCLRKWLTMAGVKPRALKALERRARLYHLSEGKIRREHTAILKALLPAKVVDSLRDCMGNLSMCGGRAPCNSGQCDYNSTLDSHICICPVGLHGDQCQTDVNECASGQHACDIAQRAICNNTYGSYLCHCRQGYCGTDGKRCEDADECVKGTHGCHGNATCHNTVGSYSCSCVDGFSGNGIYCDEILCSEKNRESKLCRQVVSLREELTLVHEQLIPRLEKRLEEQEKHLSSTTHTIISLSRALTESQGNSPKDKRCHGIAAWKYYPFVDWGDGGEQKEVRRITYNKTRSDTILRVAFHSTFAQQEHGGCAEWYIKFAGSECTRPAPITTSVYIDHATGIDGFTTIPAELSGFCNATTSASSISTGPVVISVHVRDCVNPYVHSNVHTGAKINGNAKVTSSFVVEEYCL